jgi:hypothetical protein
MGAKATGHCCPTFLSAPIMGGYGHTRLREQVFGGATRDMFSAADSPMLVAH